MESAAEKAARRRQLRQQKILARSEARMAMVSGENISPPVAEVNKTEAVVSSEKSGGEHDILEKSIEEVFETSTSGEPRVPNSSVKEASGVTPSPRGTGTDSADKTIASSTSGNTTEDASDDIKLTRRAVGSTSNRASVRRARRPVPAAPAAPVTNDGEVEKKKKVENEEAPPKEVKEAASTPMTFMDRKKLMDIEKWGTIATTVLVCMVAVAFGVWVRVVSPPLFLPEASSSSSSSSPRELLQQQQQRMGSTDDIPAAAADAAAEDEFEYGGVGGGGVEGSFSSPLAFDLADLASWDVLPSLPTLVPLILLPLLVHGGVRCVVGAARYLVGGSWSEPQQQGSSLWSAVSSGDPMKLLQLAMGNYAYVLGVLQDVRLFYFVLLLTLVLPAPPAVVVAALPAWWRGGGENDAAAAGNNDLFTGLSWATEEL